MTEPDTAEYCRPNRTGHSVSGEQFDLFEIGGCGCMTDDPPDYAIEEAS